MSGLSTKILDHIVHITPPGTLEKTCKDFRDLGFQVIAGGQHTGRMTANALVIFQDGTYFELVSFTHEPPVYPPSSPDRHQRETHPWAAAPPGWLSYAFLGTNSVEDSLSEVINKRAERDGSGVLYKPEMIIGRVRPDGVALQFILSTPDAHHGLSVLPFFCGDVTPREWRVPTNPASNTHHACRAVGIAHIRVLAIPGEIEAVAKQLSTVIGESPSVSTEMDYIWVLDTPGSDVTGGDTRLILSLPHDDVEKERAEQHPGIYEIGLWVKSGGKRQSLTTPYGKLLLLPSE